MDFGGFDGGDGGFDMGDMAGAYGQTEWNSMSEGEKGLFFNSFDHFCRMVGSAGTVLAAKRNARESREEEQNNRARINQACRPIWLTLPKHEQDLFYEDYHRLLDDVVRLIELAEIEDREMPVEEAVRQAIKQQVEYQRERNDRKKKTKILIEQREKEKEDLITSTCKELVDESTIESDLYISFDE